LQFRGTKAVLSRAISKMMDVGDEASGLGGLEREQKMILWEDAGI
jgi:hypothetical protein